MTSRRLHGSLLSRSTVRILAAILVAGLEPAAARAATVTLEFDSRVPSEYLRLCAGKIIDDDSLDAWVDLPGNGEILALGAVRGDLDREELRENLWHSILGHSGRRGEGLGRLAFDPQGDLRSMLVEISGKETEIGHSVGQRVASYLPDEAEDLHAIVRLHLGGTWDGRARDDIYLNLTFFHEFAPPWLGAIEAILAHETLHLAHRALDALPEDASTPEGLFAIALSQIHSEGYARHVEFGLLEGAYPPGTYAAFVKRRYSDGLASFAGALERTEELREICLRRHDAERCRRVTRAGLLRGGDTYAIGHGMARAIESALGRTMLASTLSGGAVRFFQLYEQAARMTPGLPSLGRGFDDDLQRAQAFLSERRESWRIRNEARQAFARADYAAAESATRRLLEKEPTDAVAAYNLACALARRGSPGESMEWLEKAVALGYRDRRQIEADADLEPLRESRAYRRLLERLSSEPSKSPRK